MDEKDRHSTGRTVGVVGLGAMGGPVVRHLLGARRRVVVWDLDPDVVEQAVAAGAAVAEGGLPGLGAASDTLLVVVPTDDDVRAVCLGHEGVLRGMRSGSTLLVCSSVRPDTCDLLGAEAPDGVDVLDAALTGGVRGAEEGAINLLVGGAEDALERVRADLDPWTRSVHHLGVLGAGQVGKTANNLVHWAQICAVTEALELGRRWGVDVPRLRRALMDGPTDSRTLRELERMRLTWHAKDLANAAAMAEHVGWDLPVGRVAQQTMPHITVEQLARLLDGQDPGFR